MKKVSSCVIPFIVACLMIGVTLYITNESNLTVVAHGSSSPEVEIIVTTRDDELNNDGDCSLREAIEAVNTNLPVDFCPAGDELITDTITFGVQGAISITSKLEVTAGGPLEITGGGKITISGKDNVGILNITTGGEIIVEHLSLRDGADMAGSIRNEGNLTFISSTVSSCLEECIRNYAALTIISSTISDCSLRGISNSGILVMSGSTLSETHDLGGIYNVGGIVRISRSVFSGNQGDHGGAVVNTYGGEMVISESVFYGNSADSGGAIFNNGSMVLMNSTLSDNSAGESGGAIYNYSGTFDLISSYIFQNYTDYGSALDNRGELNIVDSIISGNVSSEGSGIYNVGVMTIDNSIIVDNASLDTPGGGITNSGIGEITNSTLTGNSAIYAGGGVYNVGILTIENSTISGNSAEYYGGGIYFHGGMVEIVNSTISSNNALSGSGIWSDAESIILTNTIVANSTQGGDCLGYIIDGGHNISLDDTCGFDPANDSMPNTDPLLGPLQDNGGSTWTHALLLGSPAIDAGDIAQCPPTDQRGVSRPQDGDGDGVEICDIGSYEYEQNYLIVTTLDDELNTDGDCSLREAITAANDNSPVDECGSGDVNPDMIIFEVQGTITVTSQLLVTTGGPLTIDGGKMITTSGGGTTRVWWVKPDAKLYIQNLLIKNGFVNDDSGGAIFNQGVLMIINSALSGNSASDYGGAIHNQGMFTVTNTTLSGNSAYWYGGGAISNYDGTLLVTSSILTGNNAYWGGALYNQGTMTVTNSILTGNDGDGGAIYDDGTLIVINSDLSVNTSDHGGAINVPYGDDKLTIINSTLSGNSSNWSGGAIYSLGTVIMINSTISENFSLLEGGAISSEGTLRVINSSLSGNSTELDGGAIVNVGTLRVTNSTLSGNGAGEGGGIYNNDEFGTTIVTDTIIAYSSSGGECIGTITDGGYNISSDDTCGFNPANDSMPNTDPLLGPLQDNGGPTWTHALLPGSPAIDTGDDAQCPPTDQRGVIRAQDGNGDGLAICDIGSFELEGSYVPPTLVVITGLDDGFVDNAYTFTANIEPLSTTLPLDYIWEAEGQEPITHTGGLSDTIGLTWQLPGIYNITVIASNRAGSVMDTHVITITDVPISGLIAISDCPTELGSITTLTATVTSGSNIIYLWDLGDGDTGDGSVVTHTYPEVGIYTATVTATNSNNMQGVDTQVTIIDVPVSGLIAINNSPTELGSITTLTATVASGSNIIYSWDFSDGEAGFGAVVTHTYPDIGIYTATVTATNSNNAQTTDTFVTISRQSYKQYLPLVNQSAEEPIGSNPSFFFRGNGALAGLILIGSIRSWKMKD